MIQDGNVIGTDRIDTPPWQGELDG